MRRSNQRGTSLVEAMTACAVATIAVVAMLFALSSGHAGIRGMRVERAALFQAQQKLDQLLALPGTDAQLAVGTHGPETAPLPHGSAQRTWIVSWVDDPLDGIAPSDTSPQDYRKVEVTVSWTDAKPCSVKLVTFFDS